MEQVEAEDDINAEITPIKLSMPVLKEARAKWFVEMEDYLSDNPQIIINGFIKASITGALDDIEEEVVTESASSGDSEDSSDDDEDDYE